MLSNFIFLVLGAVLGVVVDRTWEVLARTTRTRHSSAMASARATNEFKFQNTVRQLYAQKGYAKNLYLPANLSLGRIPILGGLDPRAPSLCIATRDFSLRLNSSGIEQMEVDERAIRARKRAGAELWDGDILYLKRADFDPIATDAQLPCLEVGVSNYFGFVSAAERWRTECESDGSHPLLENHYATLERLLRTPPKPLALSAAAVCIFNTPDGLVVPMAHRSNAVVNAMGSLCLAPTFGLEPNRIDERDSQFDVLKYNFVKEFLEEIFNLDLAHSAESGILDPDTIFDNPDAKGILAEFTAQRARLNVTGLAGELTDGSLVISLLAEFDSTDFYRQVATRSRPAWEWQPHPGTHQHIRFYPLDSFTSGERDAILPHLAHSSAFALDRAISVLRSRMA